MITMKRERIKYRRCMIHISADSLHFTCQPVSCHLSTSSCDTTKLYVALSQICSKINTLASNVIFKLIDNINISACWLILTSIFYCFRVQPNSSIGLRSQYIKQAVKMQKKTLLNK